MDFESRQPIYLQIGEYICENILQKRWTEGDKIPSVRDLAVSVQVNPNTVMRTYTHLQEKGIIFNKRGIGYFVNKDAFKEVHTLKVEDFVKQELPRLFETMDLLGLDFDDLKKLYEEYQKESMQEENHEDH